MPRRPESAGIGSAEYGDSHTAIRPRRKRPGHPHHTPENKIWNTGISQLRWAVEHAIAHWKDWKILASGYRARLSELPHVIRIVTMLEHYRQGW